MIRLCCPRRPLPSGRFCLSSSVDCFNLAAHLSYLIEPGMRHCIYAAYTAWASGHDLWTEARRVTSSHVTMIWFSTICLVIAEQPCCVRCVSHLKQSLGMRLVLFGNRKWPPFGVVFVSRSYLARAALFLPPSEKFRQGYIILIVELDILIDAIIFKSVAFRVLPPFFTAGRIFIIALYFVFCV